MQEVAGTQKYVVCPECEGEGYIGGLGAFTPAEFTEWYGSADEYMEAHEASKQACDFCKGMRVVSESMMEGYEEYLEYEAEKSAYSRMTGGY
jgi:hypothetical protein